MRVVIIEDERLTANDLAKTIKGIEPDIEIIAFLTSVEESIEYLKFDTNIDLIFSDIELGDGLSFDIFEKLNLKIPIIFCTAYNKYALEAFRTVGIDYILKPFNKISVEKTLNKYRLLREKLSGQEDSLKEYSGLLSSLKKQFTQRISSIIVYQGDKIVPINGEEIALFFLENEVIVAHTFDQKKYLVSQNLENLEKIFSPTFFRANRQFLINRKAVKDASHFFNRKMLINLTIPFKEQIVVGKLKITAFINWLAEY